HAAREPGQGGMAITGLVERVQHELGHVGFPGRRGPVAPGAPLSLPPREPLLGEPVQDRHHCGVREIPLGEATADLPDRERVAALPEDVHDRALKVAKTIHEATVPGAYPDESTLKRVRSVRAG